MIPYCHLQTLQINSTMSDMFTPVRDCWVLRRFRIYSLRNTTELSFQGCPPITVYGYDRALYSYVNPHRIFSPYLPRRHGGLT